jgi:hypothetical protein
MLHLKSLVGALALAGTGIAVAGCGQSVTTPSPSPTIPAGCNTPTGYVFTDGSAHANVTASAGGTTSTPSPTPQSINVTGVWTDQFESSRPNERYDPTAYRGGPWLNVNLGSSSKGVVVEIHGQDPCSLSPDSSHSYVAVVFGTDDNSRYGGPCSVKVDALNSAGFRGSFNCSKLQQFRSSASPTVDARGTFAATGHVYTPTSAPTAAPSHSATPTPTVVPATPTPTASARTLAPTATP